MPSPPLSAVPPADATPVLGGSPAPLVDPEPPPEWWGAPKVPGYRVVRELARGGMGVVYEAFDTRLNRTVALKMLSEALTGDAEHRARAVTEAEAVARLHHPNVVQIYEIGDYRGRPFLALEYVRGGSLADRLARGPLTPNDAVHVVRGIALAVQHAHDRGVIHRDLKPGNVLLEPPDAVWQPPAPKPPPVPRVTDFGLAKFSGRDDGWTRTGMIMGTPRYLAPEVIHDTRAVTPLLDVWALGVILYECLAGESPFAADTYIDTLLRVTNHEPPAVRRLRPGVPRSLDAVVRKAMAKDPKRRYQTAKALADDLARVAAGRRVRARAPSARLRAFGRLARRAALVGACIAAGAGGIAYRDRGRAASASAKAARDFTEQRQYVKAEAEARAGFASVDGWPGYERTAAELRALASAGQRGRFADQLHSVADQLRFAAAPDALSDADRAALVAAANELWRARDGFAPTPGAELPADVEDRIRADLTDVALISAAVLGRAGDAPAALARLDEAEALSGPSPAVARVRAAVRGGRAPDAAAPDAPAWELAALGRYRLLSGDPDGGADLLRRAVESEPRAFWPHYLFAAAEYGAGRYNEAVAGYSAALAVADPPGRARCHFNRALAHRRRGDPEAALRDLDRVLELDANFPGAAFRRGVIYHEAKRYAEASADFERAAASGGAAGDALYQLARVRRDAGDAAGAADAAARSLRAGGPKEARDLLPKVARPDTPNPAPRKAP